MIRGLITHPIILGTLAAAGHRSTLLICDGHYAAATSVGPNAVVVHLNLEAGNPTVPRVVELIAGAVVIEKRTIMEVPEERFARVQDEVNLVLGSDVELETVSREDFYTAARSTNLALCVVTGDVRRFSNVLLTVGVNMERSGEATTFIPQTKNVHLDNRG